MFNYKILKFKMTGKNTHYPANKLGTPVLESQEVPFGRALDTEFPLSQVPL